MPISTRRPSLFDSDGDPGDRALSELDLARMKRTPQVKVVRRALGLTQDEFAARYCIPLGTLRDWEQGRTEPDQTTRAYLKVIAAEPVGTATALVGRINPGRVIEDQLNRTGRLLMSGKTTSSKAATAASKTLSSGSTASKSKSAAGSALSQRETTNSKNTSAPASAKASKTLSDGRSSKASKSAAGSALAQKK